MDIINKFTFVVLIGTLFIAPALATTTTIAIDDVFVEPDENAVVAIMINNVTNVGTADINVTYNSSIVHVIDVINSDFDFIHAVDNISAGFVRIGVMDYSDYGLNGNVKLGDMILQAVGNAGESDTLDISINELKKAFANETSIPAEVDNGIFTIFDSPQTPFDLLNTTDCFRINWTWTTGLYCDFVEVRINGTWKQNCTAQYYNSTFPAHATCTISLRGYNSGLNRYSEYINQTTTIPNHAPVAIGQTVHIHNNVGSVYASSTIFNASASHDPDNDNISHEWDFGDESHGNSSLVEHTYSSYNWNGSGYEPFEVSLKVMDDFGDSSTVNMYVNVYIPGDANGDGVVDILDATITGMEWDSKCTDNWNDQSDQADLNNDCCVDILDAVIVGTNWEHEA